MLWRCLLAMTLSILGARTAACAEFPYIAYINSDDVYVRSGPGRNYYPTDKLAKGGKVEVYRHDPGGWYAIRPPAQSFSWVSSRHLELADAGLAKVNAPRVVARVGSAFSEVRDVIQVRLDRGEIVELVDARAGLPLVQDFAAIRRISLGILQIHRPRAASRRRQTGSSRRRARGRSRFAGRKSQRRAIRLASSQQAVDIPVASVETRGPERHKVSFRVFRRSGFRTRDGPHRLRVVDDRSRGYHGLVVRWPAACADAAMNAAKTPVEVADVPTHC